MCSSDLFTGARLQGTKLLGATLRRARFAQADLDGAQFTNADVWDASFSGAINRPQSADDALIEPFVVRERR
mgnify:FL=1